MEYQAVSGSFQLESFAKPYFTSFKEAPYPCPRTNYSGSSGCCCSCSCSRTGSIVSFQEAPVSSELPELNYEALWNELI